MYVLMDTHTGTHGHTFTHEQWPFSFDYFVLRHQLIYACFFFLDTRGSSQSALPDVPHSVSGVQVCLVMNSVCTLCLCMCLHFGHNTNRLVFLCVSAAASGLETDAAFRAAVVGGPGSVQECLSGGNSTSWTPSAWSAPVPVTRRSQGILALANICPLLKCSRSPMDIFSLNFGIPFLFDLTSHWGTSFVWKTVALLYQWSTYKTWPLPRKGYIKVVTTDPDIPRSVTIVMSVDLQVYTIMSWTYPVILFA